MIKDKVIIVAQNFKPEAVGGASRIYEMARLLGQQFNQVCVLCPPPTYPFGKYTRTAKILFKENIDKLQIIRIWTFQPRTSTRSPFQRILYYVIFSILASFYLMIRCHDASHIIISTPPSSLLMSTLVARMFKKKLIIDIRDLWVEAAASLSYIKKESTTATLVKKFEQYCWRKSDRLLTNSMCIYDMLVDTMNGDNKKIKYFPFNVDLNTFEKLDIERDRQIVYIGNFGVAQNLEALISATPLVLKVLPDLRIQLYGGGDCEADIKNKVRHLGLEHYIEFYDPVPRESIPKILSRSLIGIIPLADNDALRYAIPTKTFEYFAAELPVVAYGSSDELERVIKQSNAGIYIRGNSAHEIANAVITLITDKSKLKEYAANGRRFVEEKSANTSLILD